MHKAARIDGLRQLLAGRPLVIVSNREPYVHERRDEAIDIERPAGGLVAALDPVMQACGGTWIAWGSGTADFDVADPDGRVRVPPDRPSYLLRRVRLSPAEVEGYYYGYANQALWPLCHMALEHARFRRRAWQQYEAVNGRFAEAVLSETADDAIVWVHDYHLARLPRFLRAARADLFTMHFWHIPWPAWDIFRACPQRGELLDGLLANDLMVFQHPRHVEHFFEAAERELGAVVNREEGLVDHDGRLTRVEAFPISVDVRAIDELARSAGAKRWMPRLRRRLGLREGQVLALGVDRLDYTKGIPERLRALERLFHEFPRWRGRLVFAQKSAPSRTQIRAYRELQRRVEGEIERLNKAFGTPDWTPIVHLPRPLPPAGMAALYRLADACVVSSLQDGMNLVAKEYVAAQVDGRGVLLLSELTGAHSELSWALPINPYDAFGTAAALAEAVTMPPHERQERMGHLRAYLAEHDIYHWMEQHLRSALHVLATRNETRWLRNHLGEIAERVLPRARLALILDFDGTLAPIVSAPELAALPDRVRAALRRLAHVNHIVIGVVSGRALEDIRSRVGIEGVIYAGNHGLEIASPRWQWSHPDAERMRPKVREAVRRLRARMEAVPGTIVEDKGLTVSVHFRQTPHPLVDTVRVSVYEEAERRGLVVRVGKRVFEIRPPVRWDKGAAVRWILDRECGPQWMSRVAVIYAGDDRTDEDAYIALPEPAITIKVGPGTQPTAAAFAVRDVAEMVQFLWTLVDWGAGADPSAVARPSARGARSDHG
ncbi:MAG TPA: bifunctional alpha,alpha-trehalose-phosphate synthase (UDP-forming)/trehalose-phosphatase [bacterium]